MIFNPSKQAPSAPMSRMDSSISASECKNWLLGCSSEHSLCCDLMAYHVIFCAFAVQSAGSLSQTSLQEGSLRCLALHKMGLYAAGDDGTIRLLEVSNDGVKLLESVKLGCPVTSLQFNTSHHHLAVGSSKVSDQLQGFLLHLWVTWILWDTTWWLLMGFYGCFFQGTIHIFNPSEPANVTQLFDVHHGQFVAVDVMSPGNEDVVVCKLTVDNSSLITS